jgi:hypothetical protein
MKLEFMLSHGCEIGHGFLIGQSGDSFHMSRSKCAAIGQLLRGDFELRYAVPELIFTRLVIYFLNIQCYLDNGMAIPRD